ncbi:MAG: Transposase [Glomeribacter sp. 1016415]|nr:Transposase [Glomeribacter sp. 1016415]MCX8567029.1 Transposase [Glomeribacter sp. 1016415]
MSQKEVERLKVIQLIVEGRVLQRDGALRLGLCVRQVKRLVRAYREQGVQGLVSQQRGKPSNRCIEDTERMRILSLVRDHYADFGPTLAAEYLHSQHGFSHCVETLRKWMIEAKLWRAKTGRKKRAHPPRLRRPRLGELIQIDGSPHDWFEGRAARCSLIVFVDDATSRVLYARFEPSESTHAYLNALHTYISRHGVPAAIYSDRHSIFTKHDPEDFVPTQFERALQGFEIESIQALTPQAKGRVERVFQTLQDRLVKAMRLAGISDWIQGNAFLEGYLLKHNTRFATTAHNEEDAHRPWEGSQEDLAWHCAQHHQRKLDKNLVLSFRGQRYILQTEGGSPRYALQGSKVIVAEHLDGSVTLRHGRETLSYRVFDAPQKIKEAADDKSLEARAQAAADKAAMSKAHRPPPHHPWKKWNPTPRAQIAKQAQWIRDKSYLVPSS